MSWCRRWPVLVAALAITACGGDPEIAAEPQPPPPFQSGSRLQARYDELPGGLSLFRGFYDTLLERPCSFLAIGSRYGDAEQGVDWCLPQGITFTLEFADAACTEPAVPAGDVGPDSLFVLRPLNSCTGVPSVFEIGDEIPAAQTFGRSGGECVSRAGEGDTRTFRRRGAELPLESFVRGEERFARVESRIGAVEVAADDGASIITAGYDFDRGESVIARAGDGGERRWYARHEAYSYGSGSVHGTTLFGDSACTVPVASKYGDTAFCPITAVTAFGEKEACTYRTRVHAAGAVVSGETLHVTDATGACVATPVAPNPYYEDIYVEMLDPLPLDAFEPVRAVEVGSGRIAAVADAGPEGQSFLPIGSGATLLDREIGAPCVVARGTDGTSRCLPPTRPRLYADAACSVPVVGFAAASECVAAEVATSAISLDVNEDDWALPFDEHRLVAYELGAVVQPAEVFVFSGGACALQTTMPTGAWHALGAEVPPDRFEAVTRHD